MNPNAGKKNAPEEIRRRNKIHTKIIIQPESSLFPYCFYKGEDGKAEPRERESVVYLVAFADEYIKKLALVKGVCTLRELTLMEERIRNSSEEELIELRKKYGRK